MQVRSLTPLPPDNDESCMKAGRRPRNDAHCRADTPAGNLQSRMFPLAYYGPSRHPPEGAPNAALQVWEDAAPMITVAHTANRRIAERRQPRRDRLDTRD